MGIQEALKEVDRELDLDMNAQVMDKFSIHFEAMCRWNKIHNLTRLVTPEKASRFHYADCVLGLSFLPESSILMDIGSGAGFPGLIAAIVRPGATVHLVEPSRKRISFLRMIISRLKIKNVTLHQKRVEDVDVLGGVISRATFARPELEQVVRRVDAEGFIGFWVHGAPKNPSWEKSCREWGLTHSKVYDYALGQNETRHILYGHS